MILLHFAAVIAIYLITAALIAWSMAASVRIKSRIKHGHGLMISVGRWGGVYFAHPEWSWRLCLGWIAFTYFPVDGDDIIDMASRYGSSVRAESDDNATSDASEGQGGG